MIELPTWFLITWGVFGIVLSQWALRAPRRPK
jgi:hypothetical protein